MKKNFTLTLLAVLFSFTSFALSSISGTKTVCVGNTTGLSDSTTGGVWFSGNTAVATISSTGVVTGVSAGTALISYYYGTVVTTTVTVNPVPYTIGGPSTVCAGSTITLSDATSGGAWSSSNTAYATANATSGIVTGVSPGVVNIYYVMSSGCGAYHTVTVTGSVITGSSTVCVGSTVTLSDATTGGVWFTSSTSVATVSSGGVVTGVAAGTCLISYYASGCIATKTMTVSSTAPSISGPSTVCVGSTITESDATTGGSWSSSNTGVATITSGGVITGVSSGTATIYYVVSGCYAYKTVTVSSASSISGSSTVCAGSTITLSTSTTGGSWSSSDTTKAKVSTGGVVTGVAGGTCTIYYSVSGCYAYKTLTVTGGSTISGPSSVCIGSTITLSDATSGGYWFSGSTAVATVSSGGVVTGIAAGTCLISYYVSGCVTTKTITVTTGASAISGPSTVCVGSTITETDATTGGSWSSSNTAVASIGATSGVITGVSAGTATIYYIAGGCYAYKTVTVTTAATLSGSSTVCVGSTITLSTSTTGGSWISSDTTKGTVSSGGVVTGIGAGTCTIYYSVGGCYAYKTVTVTSGSTIYGPSTVCAGSTITLSDATSGGTWITSSTSIATVSTGGVVTGVSAGVVNIYYSAGGCYAYHTVTVTGGATIYGPSTVCAGSTITLSDATSGGTWITSSTSIATVSTAGVVTGVSSGSCTIYYSVGGCYAYHTVTVTGGTISGPSTVCIGSTITLSSATTGGTWTTSGTSIATVSSGGVVTGVSAGTCTIYYLVGGCYAYKTVTVTGGSTIYGPSTVCTGSTITLSDATSGGSWISGSTSIATVNPTSGVVTGVSAGVLNIYYSAGGCYAYHTVTVTGGATIYGPSTVCAGSTITLSTATTGGTWTCSSSSVATVSSGGVVTGVSAGTCNIYYSVGGCYAYHTVTVSGGAISGPSTVCTGSTITLSSATTGGTWTTSSSTVATVSSGGVITGVSSGTCTIYYLVGGCYAYKTVTVTGGSSISGPSTVCAGSTITLSDATSGGTWFAGSTSIATVSSGGVVTGVSAGVTSIYYVVGGCYAYYSVTVTGGATIYGPSTVCAGSTITLSDATSGGTWITSSTSIATVSTGGVVTGVSAGTCNIYYSVGGCYAYHTVTVTGGATIYGPSTVCTGSTITLSDATSGGTWITSSTSTATVSSGGVVTGVSGGTCTIYYSVGGCYAYHTVTVTGGATIYGPSTVCVSSTITLSDATSGGTWTSSSTSIATVSSTGVVTGISSGTCNIYYLVGGCYAYHTVTVTGTAPIYGPSSVYVGSTITLSDATTGGTWISSSTSLATISTGGVVTGVSTGVLNIYYVIGGCGAYHTVTVLSAPPGYISGTVVTGSPKGTSGDMPVIGLLINLKDVANNVITYTNTDNTGAYSFNSLPNGDYIIYPQDIDYITTPSPVITLGGSAVSVTGINFKEYTSTKTIVPVIATGIKSISNVGELSIFPNPTNGNLNIKWGNQLPGIANVVITDVVGREVYKSGLNINTESGQTQIGLSGLNNGVYLITIKSDNIYYSSKLILQK